MATTVTEEQKRWLFASFKPTFFFRKHKLRHRHDRWRMIAELLKLSRAAKGRLEWMIFAEKNNKDVSLTARHFGIARKTYYKWAKRFEQKFLKGLEDESRAPIRVRRRQYTARQYDNVVSIRRQYLRYGKMKLLELYRRKYP